MADLRGAQQRGGDTPHDSVDSGRSLKLGARAIALGSSQSAVAASDRTLLLATLNGVLLVDAGIGTSNATASFTREARILESDGNISHQVLLGAEIFASQITRISVAASAANTVDVAVRLYFNEFSQPTPSLAGTDKLIFAHPGIAPGSVVTVGDGSGIIGHGIVGSGDDLAYACTVPTGGEVRIVVTGVTQR